MNHNDGASNRDTRVKETQPEPVPAPKPVQVNLLDLDAPIQTHAQHTTPAIPVSSQPSGFADFSGFQSAAVPKTTAQQGFADFSGFSVSSKPQQTVAPPKPASLDDFGDFTTAPVSGSQYPFQNASQFGNQTLDDDFTDFVSGNQIQAPANSSGFGDFSGINQQNNQQVNLMHSPPKTQFGAFPQEKQSSDAMAKLVNLDMLTIAKTKDAGPSLNSLSPNPYQPSRQF
jgi:hypothetical protein